MGKFHSYPMYFSPQWMLLAPRPTFALAVALGMIFVSGCRKDNATQSPSPSPTATASPSATPDPDASPTPTPTPTPTTTSVSLRNRSVAGPATQVVQANADILHAAGLDALNQTLLVESLLQALTPSTNTDLADAGKALATAYQAFLQAEAAIFYSANRPDWAEPLGSLAQKSQSPETPGFASVARLLTAYPSIPQDSFGFPPNRGIALANLRNETSLLKESLEKFVADWDPSISDNFRAQTFLADTPNATGMIFQGLLSVTDQLILDQASPSPDRERLLGRLEGIQTIYSGRYDTLQFTTIWSPGLKTLVQEVNPSLAKSLDRTLDRLMTSWSESDDFGNESAPSALQEFKGELIQAAQALGYPVEFVPAPKDQP